MARGNKTPETTSNHESKMLLSLVVAASALVAAAPTQSPLPHSVSWHLKDGVKKHQALNLAATSAHLTYYGGPVIPKVEVHPIYYGAAQYQSQTNAFYAGVVQSSWYDVFAQYNVARGSAVPGFSVAATSSSLDDVNDIQPFLINLIKTGQIKPTANTYYPIHFAPEMVAERIGRIDVVICNAGIFNDAAFALHPIYNIETQFVVNHLSHFQLVNHLLPVLGTDSKPSRVVIVTSSGQKHVSMDGISYESLETNKNYPPMTLYGQSKLANMLFAVGLNTRYQSRIVATTVHPGEVATEIYRPPRFSLFWWLTPIVKLYQWWFHLPPSTAARTVLAAASFSIPDNEIRGQYFLPPGVISKDHHVLAKDETAADRLWKYSENICNKY
ncbi:hypothetical protein HDU79_002264 [Rhizoclosmatium sp. JEL0117]|nr:hypothetical protein HDU79_002264 [Rhizoclosmatium sp. JEL0117]